MQAKTLYTLNNYILKGFQVPISFKYTQRNAISIV